MIKRLKNCLILISIIFIPLSFMQPAFADDSGDDKVITLTINWLEDKQDDRPESITIELYRVVDGQEVAMDSKVVTKENSISTNSWEVSFNYYYGQVWEYAFKILGTKPINGLYNYQLIESGNGTANYSFDFLYGHGNTEMTIILEWDDNSNSNNNRPESVTVDLYSLNGDQTPERSVILTGNKTDSKWSAMVSGLDYSPKNYYIVLTDLPSNYDNVITRGDDESIYISTNSYISRGSVESNSSQTLSNAIDGVIETINPQEISTSNGIFNNIWLNFLLLISIAILSYITIMKHRILVRNRRRARGRRRNAKN